MSMDGLYEENAGAIFFLAENFLKLPRPAHAPYLHPCRQQRRWVLIASPKSAYCWCPMGAQLENLYRVATIGKD